MSRFCQGKAIAATLQSHSKHQRDTAGSTEEIRRLGVDLIVGDAQDIERVCRAGRTLLN